MYKINLEEVDTDGAVREAEAAVAGDTRLDFLRKAGITGGAAMGGGAVLAAFAPTAMAAKKKKKKSTTKKEVGQPDETKFGKGDVGIFNYALTLEYLEAAFYTQAVANIKFSDPHVAALANKIAADEQAHVKFLTGVLGSSAVKSPTFNFGAAVTDQAKFLATAQVLENTGVKAYTGQGLNIAKADYVLDALSILTIEARHAGAIGYVNDASANAISPEGAFDKKGGLPASDILAAVSATQFITG